MTNSDEKVQVIPEAAVEAAAHALFEKELGRPMEAADEGLYAEDIGACREDARAALEAAAPHMLAGVIALAAQWETEGEQSMDAAKKIPDEGMAAMLLMDGATMVENARLIRNAIGVTA